MKQLAFDTRKVKFRSKSENEPLGFGLLLVIPTVIYQAMVAKMIWGWFLVPAGLPELSLLAAIGLRLCTINYHNYKKDDKVNSVIFWLLGPFVTLVVAAAVKFVFG